MNRLKIFIYSMKWPCLCLASFFLGAGLTHWFYIGPIMAAPGSESTADIFMLLAAVCLGITMCIQFITSFYPEPGLKMAKK